MPSVTTASTRTAQPPDGVGVSLDRVTRRLGGRTVIDALDLDIAPHERLAIVGRSGVGKSTLLGLIAGLDPLDGGTISVAGEAAPIDRLARCALMPQRDCLLPWRSALDNAAIALENQGLPRRAARAAATPLLAALGLTGAEALHPAQLSGGMRQRIAFIRTLLSGKQVLLLDEPFGALDAITRAEAQEWLVGVLTGEPRTVVLVTHDVEEALLLCDRIVVLAEGRTVLDVPVRLQRSGPRRGVVTSPAFLELRERALEAIG